MRTNIVFLLSVFFGIVSCSSPSGNINKELVYNYKIDSKEEPQKINCQSDSIFDFFTNRMKKDSILVELKMKDCIFLEGENISLKRMKESKVFFKALKQDTLLYLGITSDAEIDELYFDGVTYITDSHTLYTPFLYDNYWIQKLECFDRFDAYSFYNQYLLLEKIVYVFDNYKGGVDFLVCVADSFEWNFSEGVYYRFLHESIKKCNLIDLIVNLNKNNDFIFKSKITNSSLQLFTFYEHIPINIPSMSKSIEKEILEKDFFKYKWE